jgi:hypothetical protein
MQIKASGISRRAKWLMGLMPLIAFLGYCATLSPTNEGPWREDQLRGGWAELNGRTVVLHNLRNFRYDSKQQVMQNTWGTLRFELDELERIWVGLSHFGPLGLAHSFLSFEMKDGRYFSISVEARLRPGQGYRPVAGVFRQYTKVMVFAAEQDIVGLRSHIRGESVLLYPAIVTANQREDLLLALLVDANEMQREPEFYNTLLDNCLTSLIRHGARLAEISATDFRVLLPGYVDRLTYAFGITPDDIPFEDARQRAMINTASSRIDDADFSRRIRCGWNNYGSLNYPAC